MSLRGDADEFFEGMECGEWLSSSCTYRPANSEKKRGKKRKADCAIEFAGVNKRSRNMVSYSLIVGLAQDSKPLSR